jgi:hypothetical protein
VLFSSPEDKPKPAKQEKKPKEGSWSAENKDVVHLDDDSFDEFVKTQSSALIMFYAPCKYRQTDRHSFMSWLILIILFEYFGFKF